MTTPHAPIAVEFGAAWRQEVAAAVARERVAVAAARLDVVRHWEQRRLALHRALHDRAQQQLLGLRVELVRGTTDVATAVRRIDEIGDDIDRLAHGLPGHVSQFDDLTTALATIAGESGIEVELRAPDSVPASAVVADLLTSAAAEALANVLRHSAAVTCVVALDVRDRCFTLEVSDPGPSLGEPAREVGGHGLAGLRARTELLGGSLDVSMADGTTVTVTVTDTDSTPQSVDFVDTEPVRAAPARSALCALLGPDTWIGYLIDGAWLDELGRPFDANSATPVVDELGGQAAAVRSAAAVAEVAHAIGMSAAEVAAGRVRAASARQLDDMWSDRNQVARRAAAMQASLARRLTTRPARLLAEARRTLTDGQEPDAAAALLLQVTNAVRDVVGVLDTGGTGLGPVGPSGDPFLLTMVADEFGVDLDLRIDGMPSLELSGVIAQMGERIIVDSPAGASVRLQVADGPTRATMTAILDGLPSPRALAFIEDTVQWKRGVLTCEPRREHVRLHAVLPCA